MGGDGEREDEDEEPGEELREPDVPELDPDSEAGMAFVCGDYRSR